MGRLKKQEPMDENGMPSRMRPHLEIGQFNSVELGHLSFILRESLKSPMLADDPLSTMPSEMSLSMLIIRTLIKKAIIDEDIKAIDLLFELSGATGKNKLEDPQKEDNKGVLSNLSDSDLNIILEILSKAEKS